MGKKNRQDSTQNITPKQKSVFYVIMIFIPILILVLLELSLRLFNYGPDLSLFKTVTINNKLYYTLNPSVKGRYFGQVNFSPDPSPENFLMPKPSGTYRIFCLGGSTTVGFPYWYNGAFTSFLRDRLNAIFPDRSIEIINMGMTATNSYTALDIAKDLMNYEPDLIIDYDGHNEFYGALGVASNEHGIQERWMTLIYLRLVHFRTFQLVNNIISRIMNMFGDSKVDYSKRTTMMEQVSRGKNVSYNSDEYLKAYNIFKDNLDDLRELCRTNKIPLILGTQVSNLKDQFPFISNNSSGISEQSKAEFQRLYKKGTQLLSNGDLNSAITVFKSAIQLDSLYANAHYKLAQCLDLKGEKYEALVEYTDARNYDELRFRTDTKFNDLIRSMKDGKTCFVADIVNDFKSISQDSLIGHNLIFEHLHPNSKGNFFIAKEYARIMKLNGLLASQEEWQAKDTVSDDVLWKNRHVTGVDEFMANQKIGLLTAGWPFRDKYQAPPQVLRTDTLKYIADLAIHDKIGWITAHEQAADYFIRRGDYFNAEREYETIVNQIPLDVNAYLKLGHLYSEQNDFVNAEKVIRSSLNIEETQQAYRMLGDIFLNRQDAEKAILYYLQIRRFPEDPKTAPENAYMIALAYLISGKPQNAINIIDQTINRYPAYRPIRELQQKVMNYYKK